MLHDMQRGREGCGRARGVGRGLARVSPLQRKRDDPVCRGRPVADPKTGAVSTRPFQVIQEMSTSFNFTPCTTAWVRSFTSSLRKMLLT